MGTVPATLYAGEQNSTGMQMPVGYNPSSSPGAASPLPGGVKPMPIVAGHQGSIMGAIGNIKSPAQAGSGTVAGAVSGIQQATQPQPPAVPVQAPNGLTVTPNPTGSPTGVSGTSGSSTSGVGAVGTNTGTMSTLTAQDASTEAQQNQSLFGPGGNLLTSYLQTGAGYNGPLAQQTINATDNAMQQQINQQYGGLQTSLADAGLSPDSSASALASSQFLSNASAQENQVAAQQYTQMYSQSQQDYLAALTTQLQYGSSLTQSQISNMNANTIGQDVNTAGNILGLI